MSIAPGTKLGQYEVQDFIGQGAMGLVYRAYHPQLERTGAVKIMQAISPDADTVARFRHEAQAIAQMRHPNIVNVYDFGEYQGTPYMIVEYVPGGSLAGRMTGGKLDQATALMFLRGIAAGLDYAHQHGVVHRDVKPANVLLGADDSPVLADFGLAKLLQGTSLRSMTGVTTGTPAYMAPEQVTGNKVGPAADRYSLATIAYEMLTGVIPFDGEALMELLYAQVHRDPQVPSSRAASLSPEVDAVIMRGLAKDPAARWESCSAFVEALAAALTATPAPRSAKTAVMAPPVFASTVPMGGAAAAGGAGVAVAERRQATVAMQFPSPPVAPTVPIEKRQRWRRPAAAVASAGLLILLLLLGVAVMSLCSPVTMAVSPNIASPGETVVVTADKVPANQPGVIELHSIVRTYPFRASSSGKVTVNLLVPRDMVLGDHIVKICWSNTCHAQTALRVVSGVAMASPSPIADTSPGTSPSPGASPTSSPTPGSTPRPTSSPTSHPTSPPTQPPTSPPKPTPTPTPAPTPSPTPNPCPTSTQAATLSQPPATMVLPSSVPVAGQNFTPNKQVTVTYTIGGSPPRSVTTAVSCNGTFSTSFAPGSLLGNGTVIATDAAGRTASRSFTIVL